MIVTRSICEIQTVPNLIASGQYELRHVQSASHRDELFSIANDWSTAIATSVVVVGKQLQQFPATRSGPWTSAK